MVVETERLLIRKWNDEDAVTVADIYLKPEVMEFIPGGVWSSRANGQNNSADAGA